MHLHSLHSHTRFVYVQFSHLFRQVLEFAEAIAQRHAAYVEARGGPAGGVYGIATEHEHSCCVLLARKDIYLKEGKWHTWIDYPKFSALAKRFAETGESFTSADYMAETPYWAVYGAEEKGFDPLESRVKRNNKGETVPVEYKSTESGCG